MALFPWFKNKKKKVIRNTDYITLEVTDFIPLETTDDIDIPFQKALLVHRITNLAKEHMDMSIKNGTGQFGTRGVQLKCTLHVSKQKKD